MTDLFDPSQVNQGQALNTRLRKIQAQARVHDFDHHAHHRRVRVNESSSVEHGAHGEARKNQAEPGLGKPEGQNRKLNEKTIDVGWDEVGNMGNVVVVLSAFALMAYAFSRK